MKKAVFLIVTLVFVFATSGLETAHAKVQGACVNCHTMHNSQDGGEMATFGNETGANNALTKGSCLGCHGQVPAGANHFLNSTPQVYHSGGTDLAGGNFAYIKGDKAVTTGDTSTCGHNVVDTSVADANLDTPPGGAGDALAIKAKNSPNFTCGGVYGCHGDRSKADSFGAVSGAHHSNVSGECDGSDIGNSYRFLAGVKGYENMVADYEYQNADATHHNEYYGVKTATDSGDDGSYDLAPLNNTISGLCAECHGEFHSNEDIGSGAADNDSPFLRHPTDVVLTSDASKEYKYYNGDDGDGTATFSVVAPVARQSAPASISGTVTLTDEDGNGDVVMCLSCHYAHAGPYEDILRWDYTTMIAETASTNTGCFICHTTKDID